VSGSSSAAPAEEEDQEKGDNRANHHDLDESNGQQHGFNDIDI
jgi:hypothetical protein